ncbi:MAG: hypothetical protein V3V00_16115 [Saprospiraceae bacterium]
MQVEIPASDLTGGGTEDIFTPEEFSQLHINFHGILSSAIATVTGPTTTNSVYVRLFVRHPGISRSEEFFTERLISRNGHDAFKTNINFPVVPGDKVRITVCDYASTPNAVTNIRIRFKVY